MKLNAQVSEEAAEWFVEFRSGDVDPAGRRAFEAWVRSSPEHLRAYLEYAAIWNEGDSVDAKREIDVAALIACAREGENIISLPPPRPAQRGEGSSLRRFAIAAGVLLVLAGASTFAYFQLFRAPTYTTDAGEQRSIRLPDGSTVELNSRSRLRVRFDDRNVRRVELLEGQALFNVVKDPQRPFLVHSGGAQVRAVGTQFDVNRKRAGTVITVIEGRVAVSPLVRSSPSAGPVFLSAGEQLSLSPQTSQVPVRANIAATTAWIQRQLVLKSAPLNEVAEEFNRYSARKLVVEDTAAEELRLSGVFATDPDFLIRYLRARPDITVVESDDDIQIIHHD